MFAYYFCLRKYKLRATYATNNRLLVNVYGPCAWIILGSIYSYIFVSNFSNKFVSVYDISKPTGISKPTFKVGL